MPSEISKPEPTTPTYEEWEVVIGKNKFLLKGQQVLALKREIANGKRGLLWFKDFAISIPHIECAYKVVRDTAGLNFQIPRAVGLTKEEREKTFARLNEIKQKLHGNIKQP